MASLQGKVIAITGAASGIALATAHECAAKGASLALCDVSGDLPNVVEEFKAKGVPVTGRIVDVSSSESVNEWIDEVIGVYGRLDGAANIAGIGGTEKIFNDIKDITNESWDKVIGVNLTGVFYCMRAQLNVMERGAAIVNAASMAGLMGRPGIGAYSVSKHGVIGLTRTAAKENGKNGIRVNAVAPGPIETPLLDKLLSESAASAGGDVPVTNTYKNVPLQRKGTAEEVAKIICFLLSDDSSFVTGSIYSVDGGIMS